MSAAGPSRADFVIEAAEGTWRRLVDVIAYFRFTFQLDQKLVAVKTRALEHPLLTLVAVVTLAMFSMPVTCFLAFACGSIFLSFMAFMIIEGVLLTLASLVLGGVLFIAGCLSLGLSTLFATAWYSVHQGRNILMSVKRRTNRVPTDPEEDGNGTTSPKAHCVNKVD